MSPQVRRDFWNSEVEPVPETVRRLVESCRARACAPRCGLLLMVILQGEDGSAQSPTEEDQEQDVHGQRTGECKGAEES